MRWVITFLRARELLVCCLGTDVSLLSFAALKKANPLCFNAACRYSWHFYSGVFFKAEAKWLPPASRREREPHLWIVFETEHSSW